MISGKGRVSLFWGTLGAIWGISGVTLLFGSALFRMYPYTRELIDFDLSWIHWVVLVFWVFFMGYGEGYKGFQCKFSPRVAARALYLKQNPSVVRVVLAPLFCMCFFYATRKRKIVSYSILFMVVVLVGLVRFLAQPWRGIIDAGVLLGLGWGLVAIWIYSLQAFWGKGFDVSPEVPRA